MAISKKLSKITENLELNIQLMATELDTSAAYLRYLSKDLLIDGVSISAFDSLIKDIEENGVEITSIDDNTVVYEYLDEAVVIHTVLGEKYILFDSMITRKIENKLDSYK